MSDFKYLEPPELRFFRQVSWGGSCGCWNWEGATDKDGYGIFGITVERGLAKKIKAHRFAFQLLVNDIPDGMTIDHLCKNTGCVNPDHMECVSLSENSKRAKPKSVFCKRGHIRQDDRKNPNKRRCYICNAITGAAYYRKNRRQNHG
jgi:hypothetical protein